MALNYSIVERNKNFLVVETATNQPIKNFNNKDVARKFMRHLNLGGGFNGWTPKFFVASE